MPDSASPLPEDAPRIEAVIAARKSIRAFLPDAVPAALITHLLEVAARAPSGTNMQPWRCYVVGGARRQALCDALVAAHAQGQGAAEQSYYPTPLSEPYLSRRRKLGWDMYGLLGIARGQTARMQAQHARNLTFFDAPVGLIFTIDRGLKIGSWLDYGMFLQTFMLAAQAHGLASCPQAAFAPYHATIRRFLPIGAGEMVVCGMALGHADPDAPVNRLETGREPARSFATFVGFDGPEADQSTVAVPPSTGSTAPVT